MIIGFKEQFEKSILDGTKIHTIREDKKNSWVPGKKMHQCTNLRTKKQHCFNVEQCISTQKIEIIHIDNNAAVFIDSRLFYSKSCTSELAVDSHNNMIEFVNNDGFKTIDDFFNWFDKDFIGKIIHWTDFKY